MPEPRLLYRMTKKHDCQEPPFRQEFLLNNPPNIIVRMHTPHARERGETAEISLLVLPWESCDKKWVIAQPSRLLNQGGSQL
jgi:hypothetical protein